MVESAKPSVHRPIQDGRGLTLRRAPERPLINPANMSTWWDRSPLLAGDGAASGVAAALWRFNDLGRDLDVFGYADPETHIVCVAMDGGAEQTYFGDGRPRWTSRHRSDHINIVRAGEHPRAILRGERAFEIFHFYLPDRALGRLAADALDREAAPVLIDPGLGFDPRIGALARMAKEELRGGDLLSRLRLDTLTQELAIALLRGHSNLARQLGEWTIKGGLAAWQVRRACEALDAALEGNVSLEALAAIVGLSATHFSRAFKQSTGLAPFHWLAERRIDKAKSLLVDTRTPLAEVALDCGFAAQPQFTTAFRRATGMTPGRWRRERTG